MIGPPSVNETPAERILGIRELTPGVFLHAAASVVPQRHIFLIPQDSKRLREEGMSPYQQLLYSEYNSNDTAELLGRTMDEQVVEELYS